ncbi:hypothetical protein BT96DRAFT_984785 [Gymnopus androsaceus JB14]|uniref:Uncharacterized protein n=1 Tax=Gymnopus androsaceus JB14 TaxID=1447944 RepID=A0A6A4IMT8_9AGAR|nr:hypothetical protein BT96DRAFT_984785 [Gymnopus androsaceus JB14]
MDRYEMDEMDDLKYDNDLPTSAEEDEESSDSASAASSSAHFSPRRRRLEFEFKKHGQGREEVGNGADSVGIATNTTTETFPLPSTYAPLACSHCFAMATTEDSVIAESPRAAINRVADTFPATWKCFVGSPLDN